MYDFEEGGQGVACRLLFLPFRSTISEVFNLDAGHALLPFLISISDGMIGKHRTKRMNYRRDLRNVELCFTRLASRMGNS